MDRERQKEFVNNLCNSVRDEIQFKITHGKIHICTKIYDKLKSWGLPKSDCSINNIFIDCINPDFQRVEHCFLNCGMKCLQGIEYKKIINQKGE